MKNVKTIIKYQQGDVILRQVSKEDWHSQNLKYQCKSGAERETLEFGEETGHTHSIYRDTMPAGVNVTLFKTQEYARVNGGMIVEGGPVILKHEEHAPIELPTGYYIQEGVQEHNHFRGQTGRVVD